MKTVSRSEIHPIRMSDNVPEVVVNAGYRIIHDKKIHHWVGIGWVEERDAERDDYLDIPELID